MITEYLEVTLLSDDTKHLFPIEAIQRVGQQIITNKTYVNGKEVENKTVVCRLIVIDLPITIKETYHEIKDQINKIGVTLRLGSVENSYKK